MLTIRDSLSFKDIYRLRKKRQKNILSNGNKKKARLTTLVPQ